MANPERWKREREVVERLDSDMIAVYRAMTPVQRVAAGLSATDLIRDGLFASLRELHPTWTDEAVAQPCRNGCSVLSSEDVSAETSLV